MAYSIETRFPWLNNDLVNFCFSLPNNFLIKNGIGKYIFRDTINKKLMWLPKRAAQTPQTKWIKSFILSKLLEDLKRDDDFFDLRIFEKKNLFKELNNWLDSPAQNSVFPWYFLMTYFSLYNILWKLPLFLY